MKIKLSKKIKGIEFFEVFEIVEGHQHKIDFELAKQQFEEKIKKC